MKIRKLRSVRTRLAASLLAMLLLPSLVIGGFSYFSAKNQVDTQLANMADTDISLVSSMVDQYIQSKIADVGQIFESISSVGNPDMLLNAYTKNHPEAEAAVYVTDDGQFSYSSITQNEPSNYNPQDQEFYAKAVASPKDVVFSEPYTSEQSGRTIVDVAQASSDGKSVVAISLDLSTLQETVGDIRIGDNGFVVIFSANSSMIVSPSWGSEGSGTVGEAPESGDTPQDVSSNLEQVAPQEGEGSPASMLDEDSGQIEQTSPEGETRELVYITNALTGWKIAGDRSPIEVAQAAEPIWNNTLLVILVFVLLGFGLTVVIVRSITKPLQTLNEFSIEVGQGDLSRNTSITSRDEFGDLGEAYDQMVGSLNGIVSEVANSSSQLAAASEQLSANAEQGATSTEHITQIIEQMAQGADRQVLLVEQSMRTIQDVAGNMGHIADNASTTAVATAHVAQKSKEGGEVIQGAVSQMSTIHQSVNHVSDGINHLVQISQEIGQIIKVISDISRQTNLLALNASIEAARAGEHGRGFAVVAREVGTLAEQAAQSAEQVNVLIGSIHEGIKQAEGSMGAAMGEVSTGMIIMDHAGRLFEEINLSVDTVNGKAGEVSTMAEHIVKETSHVVAAIEDISHLSHETAAGAQTVSAATEEQLASMQEISSSSTYLARMAARLQKLTEKFKV
ncbi:methyl-accepting chemotaxis protein [Paenibacillus xylanilyticus]|uniref:methyl-accepting chemotaxis protein n=1 Tax=Paenibacillus xylanilyticus TaxID=248903 RepID=UPI00129EDC6A|nr:methyl-accepting chemotaxis protein [Paenibacillus xylanilyticus]